MPSAGLMHRFQVDPLAPEPDAALARPMDAGDQRDQGRFAGAILAEQDMHLARAEIEVDAVESNDAGEVLVTPSRRSRAGTPDVSGVPAASACAAVTVTVDARVPYSTPNVGLKSSGASEEALSKSFTFLLSMM